MWGKREKVSDRAVERQREKGKGGEMVAKKLDGLPLS